MWQGWIDLIMGLWVLSCGFVNRMQTADNIWVPGVIIFVFGLWSAIKGKSWQGLINSFLGLWLFLSGVFFALNVGWNFIISGALIAILSLWNVSVHHDSSIYQRA